MRKLMILGIVLACLGAVIFYILTMPATLAEADLPKHTPDVANGEYMFYASGCASCHAKPGAKGEEKKKLVGGHAFKTPFGTFYAPNISPDKETGIGNWSMLDFVNAVKLGTTPDGSHYYPAFPFNSYQRMMLTDIMDLKAYMDTLPAVKSDIPDHDLGFPFNIRRGLGLWKLLYIDGKTYEPDQQAKADVQRGGYLVNGPGHCIECHSPRNFMGGIIKARAYAGGPNPDGKGFIPNLTPHKTGLGAWSKDEIAESLETGFTPSFDSFGGSMVAVQENMAKLKAEDRMAIAAYLKALPPIATEK